MKQIRVRESDLPALDVTVSDLWRDSTLSLIGPEEQSQEDQGNTNASAVRRVAKELALPETATLEQVLAELEKRGCRELIFTYDSGETNTFYLTPLQLDRYPALDAFY